MMKNSKIRFVRFASRNPDVQNILFQANDKIKTTTKTTKTTKTTTTTTAKHQQQQQQQQKINNKIIT
jgi:hypothetical protein